MVYRNKFLSQSTQHCKRLLPVTWLKAMSIAMVLSDGGRVPKIGFGRGQIPLPAFCESIATDYVEACRVLLASAKASAALSRRCLQVMPHDQGYKNRDLAKQVEQLLNANLLPQHIQETVDAIRNFGNFSAHPINDKTSLQVIDLIQKAMPLYWLCYRHNNQACVVIEPAHSLIHARLRAALDGLDEGEFTEGHELPRRWKVAEQMIGRRLSQADAKRLLAKFE